LRLFEASAALPSPRAGPDQVGEDLAVERRDDGAVGHRQDHALAVGAVAVVALALLAARGTPVRAVVVVQQRGDLRVDDEHDVAAVPAVAAVRAAERLELLAVDRRAAVAAVAGSGVQHDAIDEGGHRAFLSVPGMALPLACLTWHGGGESPKGGPGKTRSALR